MSSSSDCSAARRPSRADAVQELSETRQTESVSGSRRSSRYEIYGTATRPFGESYRRSLQLQNQPLEKETEADQERTPTPDSPLDTDSVEEDMGCSTSKSVVVKEVTKGTFQTTKLPPQPVAESRPAKSNCKVNGVVMKTINNNTINNYTGLSDFEIIYGTKHFDKNTTNNIDEGYSTTDIYSEVKKPEKKEYVKENHIQLREQATREKLMQQIRNRKSENKEKEKDGYCSFATIENSSNCVGEENLVNVRNEENETNPDKCGQTDGESTIKMALQVEPVSFVEEEYSYEPGNEEVTNKLVVRSRSLVNLDQNQTDYKNACTLTRPNKLKITTKPDGTIRYGFRQGFSESDLIDDDSPPLESERKINYVSSIRSAFDAAIGSQNRDKSGRAEAFDGLRQYFQDNKHGLQELLINNNVVIIEPYRPDPPKSPSEKSDTSSQRTCRITGATIKSPNSEQKPFIPSNTLPRRHTKGSRPAKQGFYHPIKVNKELIDAELPDPDKVKNAKELFEKIFRSRTSTEEKKKTPSRSFFNTITSKMRITPEVKVIKEGIQTSNDKKKQNRIFIDQVVRDDIKRCSLQRRWTDSGSLSSGVSSDLSYDQDCDYYQHESPTLVEEYSSDDDVEYIYPYDDTETHPVSSEVLQKIRACGTTITYYGGRIISRSHGPLRSPMTMTIMDEIRRHGGTHEGRKRFEEEPTLGVKFRLVKSHSCGSRLEIAGTEEEAAASRITMTSPRHESLRGESIAEEVTEARDTDETQAKDRNTERSSDKRGEEENHTSLEEEEDKAEADRYLTSETNTAKGAAPATMTWAELKLKEARRLWHCTPEAVRAPPQDMEFETFEVLEDPQPHKQDKSETGRG